MPGPADNTFRASLSLWVVILSCGAAAAGLTVVLIAAVAVPVDRPDSSGRQRAHVVERGIPDAECAGFFFAGHA